MSHLEVFNAIEWQKSKRTTFYCSSNYVNKEEMLQAATPLSVVNIEFIFYTSYHKFQHKQ